MKKIGILNPGMMGAAVAQTMVNFGHEVYWVSKGRSPATHARASKVGLRALLDLGSMMAACDALVSVVPPHAAESVADEVIAAGFQGHYLDANAISPPKTKRIGEKMAAAGVTYTDGSIIGGPPTERGQTRLQLSGPFASETLDWFTEGPLDTVVVGDEIGAASALKMCYAAYTKGTTALLTAILAGAEAMGVRAELEAEWGHAYFGDGFVDKTHGRVTRTANNKAWRFVGEMEEMVETFGALDIPNGYFQAAADTYRAVAHFKEAEEPGELTDVLNSLGPKSLS